MRSPPPAGADIAPFTHDFQVPVSQEAQFNVSGAATGGDLEGDAFLDSVVYTSGMEYTQFYRPDALTNLIIPAADAEHFHVRGGTNITVGRPGAHWLSDAESTEAFAGRVLDAFENRNLNHYFDIGGRPTFSFVIAFQRAVRDDDPTVSDAHGELLFLERGREGGNSWLTMQAVDAFGVPLGPELAVSPEETYPTTPVFSVRTASQKLVAWRSTCRVWGFPRCSTSSSARREPRTPATNRSIPPASTFSPTSS